MTSFFILTKFRNMQDDARSGGSTMKPKNLQLKTNASVRFPMKLSPKNADSQNENVIYLVIYYKYILSSNDDSMVVGFHLRKYYT